MKVNLLVFPLKQSSSLQLISSGVFLEQIHFHVQKEHPKDVFMELPQAILSIVKREIYISSFHL